MSGAGRESRPPAEGAGAEGRTTMSAYRISRFLAGALLLVAFPVGAWAQDTPPGGGAPGGGPALEKPDPARGATTPGGGAPVGPRVDAPVPAAARPDPRASDSVSALTQTAEARIKRKQFAEAALDYAELIHVRRRGEVPDKNWMLFLLSYGRCLFETGGKREDPGNWKPRDPTDYYQPWARAAFQRVIEKKVDDGRPVEPNNIVALFYLARLDVQAARQKIGTRYKLDELSRMNPIADAEILQKLDPREREAKDKLDSAKKYLQTAAREGFAAIAAIRDTEELKAAFGTDAPFQLDLINEPKLRTVRTLPGQVWRDPFRNPFAEAEGGEPPPDIDTPEGPEQRKAILARLETLIIEIERAYDAKDYEEVYRKTPQIQQIFEQAKAITGEEALAEKLDELRKRYEKKLPFYEQVIFIYYQGQCEKLIAEMRERIDTEDFTGVQGVFDRLVTLTKKMESENPGVFGPEARKQREKGEELNLRAQKLKRIGEIKIDITGIIHGPGIYRTIINGKHYAKGDEVPTPDAKALVVVEDVGKREVTFSYQGEKFTRKLGQR